MKALLGTTSLFSSVEKLQLEHGVVLASKILNPQKVQKFNFSLLWYCTRILPLIIPGSSHKHVFRNGVKVHYIA